MITKLPIPDEYDAYITRLAEQLENAGVITIDGRSAVLIAALNLLIDFVQKIGADTEEEKAWRLQVLADLSEVRQLSD